MQFIDRSKISVKAGDGANLPSAAKKFFTEAIIAANA